jgi:hypothetical protein
LYPYDAGPTFKKESPSMWFVIPAEMVQAARNSESGFSHLFGYVRTYLDQKYPAIYDDILSEVFLYSFQKYTNDTKPYFASYLIRMLNIRLRHTRVRSHRRRVSLREAHSVKRTALQWVMDREKDSKTETPATAARDLLYGPLGDISECSRALISLLHELFHAQQPLGRTRKHRGALSRLCGTLQLQGYSDAEIESAVQCVRLEAFCG